LILGGELAVLQAPMFEGLAFDPFVLFDDGLVSNPSWGKAGGREEARALCTDPAQQSCPPCRHRVDPAISLLMAWQLLDFSRCRVGNSRHDPDAHPSATRASGRTEAATRLEHFE
jgi:hypothetical protein